MTQHKEQMERVRLEVKQGADRLQETEDRAQELEQEIDTRDACESKVQDYVKTLVQKNEELQQKLRALQK